MKRFLKTMLAFVLVAALVVPAWAFGPAESDVFTPQLDDYAQQIYAKMLTPEVLACLRSGESYDIDFDGPFDNFKQAAGLLHSANAYAFSAFEYNYPEYFWLDACRSSVSGSDERLTLTVTPNFETNWLYGGRSVEADSAALTAAVQALAAEAAAQGGTYEQLLYVHDWLTTHNEYDSDAANEGGEENYFAWTPLAALTDEGQPICEGYSKAFKLVCDELGIPCILADGWAGGGHMWNQVLLNGAWYAVDVTFDDPSNGDASGNVSGRETREYFLVGADTVIDGLSFADTHVPDGERVAGTQFTLPELASEAATPESVAPQPPDEPERIVFADVDELAYYAPAVTWAVQCEVTNGMGWDEQGNALFMPEFQVNRGQAVTFLWRANWCPEPETTDNRFSDVAAGSYYEKAVLWAIENGITNGTTWDEEAGVYEFSPDAPVTRGQMLTFLWRSVGKPGETETYEGKQWFSDAERWGDESGCIYGTAEAYATGADCPRADVVYYLWHAVLSMAG